MPVQKRQIVVMSLFFLSLPPVHKRESSLLVVGLLSEGAAGRESGLATGRGRHDGVAAGADDHRVGVREDGLNLEAAWALDVHEETVGSLYQTLLLVLGLLTGQRWVEEVDSKRRGVWGLFFGYFFFCKFDLRL